MAILSPDRFDAFRRLFRSFAEAAPDSSDEGRARALLDSVLGSRAEGLALAGDLAAVRTVRGVEMFRLSGPRPQRMERVVLPGVCRSVGAFQGGLLAGDDRGGLFRLGEEGPVALASLPDPIRCLASSGECIAVGAGDEVLILEAGDGDCPELRGRISLPGGGVAEDLAFGDAGILLVAAGEGGILVIEVGSHSLSLKSRASFPARALAATSSGGRDEGLVVAWSPAGRAEVLEWSHRRGIRGLSGIDLEIDGGAPEAGAVAVEGTTAYVATDTRLLHVLDLRTARDRCGPVQLSTVSVGTYTTGVAVTPETVYASDAWGGLVALDRSRLDSFDDEDPVLYRLSLREPGF